MTTVLSFLRKHRSDIAACLLLLAVSLIVYGRLLGPLIQNGDAAVYNQQFDEGNLAARTVHIGYVAAGILFRKLLPGDTDLVANVMTFVFGTIGTLAVYLTAARYTGRVVLRTLAAAATLAVPSYAFGMVLSEVDVPLASILACSWCALAYGWLAVAGLLYGYAMLISPLAAWSLPVFAVALIRWRSDEGKGSMSWLETAKPLFRFGVVGLLTWAPVVALSFRDYFFGGRGIFNAPRIPFAVMRQLGRSAEFFHKDVPVLAPLLLAGLLICLLPHQRNKRSPALGLIVSMSAIALFGDRLLDVPVQLPQIILACPLLAVLGEGLWNKLGPLVPLGMLSSALLLNGFGAYARTAKESRRLRAERATYLAMKRESAPLPCSLVGLKGFSANNRFNRVVRGGTPSSFAYKSPQFQRDFGKLAKRASRVFWFAEKPPNSTIDPFAAGFDLSKQRLGKKDFWVLTPKKQSN